MNISFYQQKDNLWLFIDGNGHAMIFPAGSCRLGINGELVTMWIRNEVDGFIKGIPANTIQKSSTPNDVYTNVTEFLEINATFFIPSHLIGKISQLNTTNIPLEVAEVFTGQKEYVKDIALICVNVYSDIDGVFSFQEDDGTNLWKFKKQYDIPGGVSKQYIFPSTTDYFRLVYTNGSTIQTEFGLYCKLLPVFIGNNIHQVIDNVNLDDNVSLVKSIISVPSNNGSVLKNVNVQNPISVDGDSVYEKDIWKAQSVYTNWVDVDNTGEEIPFIPFVDVHTRIRNSSAANPKILTIHFNRVVQSTQIEIGVVGDGDFSNLKITLLGSGTLNRVAADDSSDSTKLTVKNYVFPRYLYCAIQLEFFTDDPVTISCISVQKSKSVSVSQVEPTTDSLKVIDYAHAEIHSGSHFLYKRYYNLLRNTTKDFLIVTPNTTEWDHFVYSVDTVTSSIIISFYRNTVVSNVGTALAIFNRNQNFPNGSDLLLYENPVITDVGTLIFNAYFGAGKGGIGGGGRDAEEFILEQNTVYLLRVQETNITNTIINVSLDWYEHTNKIS